MVLILSKTLKKATVSCKNSMIIPYVAEYSQTLIKFIYTPHIM
jgi:hypothetical protein